MRGSVPYMVSLSLCLSLSLSRTHAHGLARIAGTLSFIIYLFFMFALQLRSDSKEPASSSSSQGRNDSAIPMFKDSPEAAHYQSLVTTLLTSRDQLCGLSFCSYRHVM